MFLFWPFLRLLSPPPPPLSFHLHMHCSFSSPTFHFSGPPSRFTSPPRLSVKMKRPKRDNSLTKSASASVTDSYSFNGHRLSCSNSSSSSPPFHSDTASNCRQHRRSSTQQKQTTNNGMADVMNKMPKINGTISRKWARDKTNMNNSNDNNETDNGPTTTATEERIGEGGETGPYTGMRDSATSSSSPCSASSTLRRPFDLPGNLFLFQQPLLNSSSNLSQNAMPSNELLFPSPTTPLLHQIGPASQFGTIANAQLGSVPLSYGPFGMPQMAGISAAAVAHQPTLFPFHHQQQPQHHLMDAQHQHQQLLHNPLPLGNGMNGVGLMPVPTQNAFEGLPIFVLPHAGTLSLNALKRAAEFKAMALNALLLHQQQSAKVDTSKHFHIFVGDISQEVDNQMLLEACQKFGTVSEAKVMRDQQSSKSRSFGFVAFPNREDAQRAIEGLNGTTLGRRPLRTGWAVRRSSVGNGAGGGGQTHGSEDEKGDQQPTQKAVITLESIYNSTDVGNSTVYLGGLSAAATDEPIRSLFSQFGTIKEIRLFASQNFGFVVFADKSSAARAIFEMHGKELDLGVVAGKCTVRVKWGRQPQQQNGGATASGGRAGDAWQSGGTATNGTVLMDGTLPTLMEFGHLKLPSAAAVRLAQQQQQQQQLAVLSAFAIQQQLQHRQQMLCLPNGFQSPLMANQTQSIANGTTGPMATFGGWANE